MFLSRALKTFHSCFQSWLSGGPTTVIVDAKLDKAVVGRCMNVLREAVERNLVAPKEHLASFGKYINTS